MRCGSRSSGDARSRQRTRKAASGGASCVASWATRVEPRALDGRAPDPGPAGARHEHRARAASRRSPTASPRSRASRRSSATSAARPPIRPRSSSRTPRAADVQQALGELRTALAADPRFGDGELERSADGEVALLAVPVRATRRRPRRSRPFASSATRSFPPRSPAPRREALVGGTSSENIDYFDSVVDPAPAVIAFVLLLTFILLTVVFRSVVVAGTAVLLNLLSVAAAYGLLVLVFQEGFGAGLLGFQAGRHDRGVGAALPLLGAVRPVDGLPGVPAQPDPGALRPDRRHDGRRHVRCRVDRAHHHRSGAHHRRRLLRLCSRRSRSCSSRWGSASPSRS